MVAIIAAVVPRTLGVTGCYTEWDIGFCVSKPNWLCKRCQLRWSGFR
jgi:hypothetical protein